ncbi:MAG: DUF1697 domain-containing protein [Betaproteobacteria bacterium]
MQTWIALFRGINVGGRNKMPMAALATTLESAGCHSVRTYIQSGNVVFMSSSKSKPNLTKKLGDATEYQFGFRPNILLLTDTDFRSAVANNPFTDAIPQPNTLHFFFLDSKPESPDIDGIAELAIASERFQLIDTVFYLHAPDGFGRSKLAAGAERKLGVATTARNYSTIHNLSDILNAD